MAGNGWALSLSWFALVVVLALLADTARQKWLDRRAELRGDE